MSSSAPLSPFSSACGGLPQPRSRIAVAAETRAAWVASLAFMTPTSALMAVLVWLRASERISVRVFGIYRILQEFRGAALHSRVDAGGSARFPRSRHRFAQGDRDQERQRERDQVDGHRSSRSLEEKKRGMIAEWTT